MEYRKGKGALIFYSAKLFSLLLLLSCNHWGPATIDQPEKGGREGRFALLPPKKYIWTKGKFLRPHYFPFSVSKAEGNMNYRMRPPLIFLRAQVVVIAPYSMRSIGRERGELEGIDHVQ